VSSRRTPRSRLISVNAVRGGVADGEQLPGAVRGHARRGEPGGLGLHGDHRDVVRHDVVELAGDAGPLTASLVLEEGRGHALGRGVARPGLAPEAASPSGAGRAQGHQRQGDGLSVGHFRIDHHRDRRIDGEGKDDQGRGGPAVLRAQPVDADDERRASGQRGPPVDQQREEDGERDRTSRGHDMGPDRRDGKGGAETENDGRRQPAGVAVNGEI
jgi:hypothetical protein